MPDLMETTTAIATTVEEIAKHRWGNTFGEMVRYFPKTSATVIVLLALALLAAIVHYVRQSRQPMQSPTQDSGQADFRANAQVFSGLYEPLYTMCGRGRFRKGLIGDWYERTAYMQNAPAYSAVWAEKLREYESWEQDEGMRLMKELLRFVQSCGIQRDAAQRLTVDETTYARYHMAEGERLEHGQQARVVTPYWRIGNTILEKGTIEKEERP